MRPNLWLVLVLTLASPGRGEEEPPGGSSPDVAPPPRQLVAEPPREAKPPADAEVQGGEGGYLAKAPVPDSSDPGPLEVKDGPRPRPRAAAASPWPSDVPILRALEVKEGRARLLVDGVEQAVVTGSWVGALQLRSVAPGRLVLGRANAGAPGEELVFVFFDAKVQARAQVLFARDPRPVVAPEVSE
jgi:hypothetical protein